MKWLSTLQLPPAPPPPAPLVPVINTVPGTETTTAMNQAPAGSDVNQEQQQQLGGNKEQQASAKRLKVER